MEKKEVKKALKKAKEIEKEKILTPKEEAALQKETVSLSEKLKKLLAPEWFVGPAKKRLALRKTAKKAKKKAVKKKKQTRKSIKKKKK